MCIRDSCQAIPVVSGFNHGNVIEILTIRQKCFNETVESVEDADPTAPDILADKLTGLVECISTHADDCVVTMQVDGNEILPVSYTHLLFEDLGMEEAFLRRQNCRALTTDVRSAHPS